MTADSAHRDDYDVIVVGAGTIGLILGRLLTVQDVRVAVIDPSGIDCQQPRASHIDDECMQTIGLADQEPDYLVMSGVEVWGDSDRMLMSWELSPGQTDQGWQSDYQFFQPGFEAILRGKLAQTELADLWLGWQATDIERHTAQVSINVQDRVTGISQVVRGGYVVGCDGSRSVGLLSPQPRAADGTLLNDLVGYRFAGVGSQVTVDAVDDAVRQAWRELGAVTVPDFGATTLWLADALADAALIRPDRYVFAATHGPEQLAQATALLRTQTTQKETV